MKELEEAGRKAMEMLDKEKINAGKWVEWLHEGTMPATTHLEKIGFAINGIISSNHCAKCLNLNGCWFNINAVPESPLHPQCHCSTMPIPAPIAGVTAIGECDIKKFTEYIFNHDPIKNKGKKVLFESWGYDIMDSEWLQAEFIRQAQEKYASGNYILGKLKEYGQLINIEIVLPRRDGKPPVSFISGWMVYPIGIIKLTTPYGDK